MIPRLSKLLFVGLLAGTVGVLASCEKHHKKDHYDPAPTYGEKCEKVAPTPVEFNASPPTPAEVAACSAAGGSVEPGGLAGGQQCVLPYCDAGQACSDSSECIGNCYTTLDFAGGIGTPTTGACQPNSNPFGCRTEVVGGQAGPTICVD